MCRLFTTSQVSIDWFLFMFVCLPVYLRLCFNSEYGVHAFVLVCVCVCVFICVCMHVHMHMCVCVCVHMCVSVFVYICVSVCVCLHLSPFMVSLLLFITVFISVTKSLPMSQCFALDALWYAVRQSFCLGIRGKKVKMLPLSLVSPIMGQKSGL